MLYCERFIAVSAYAEVKGIAGPNNEFADLADLKESVIELYTQYKIASGIHHAEQLIRDIERQAAQLANQQNL
ncbi:MAG TPA: hypothetical protein VHX65_02950 [Pirellulales bacterium]|jgi:hypothetical protein|nr:hypothetical protein [Pirellulales bacterium]